MKNETLYNKTVDILVQAYFDNTLEHGNCYACAVGNIIAGNCGKKFLSNNESYMMPYNVWTGQGILYWDSENDFSDNILSESGKTEPELTRVGKKHILSTGYSYDNLLRIETAFERCDRKGDRMFNGLMAVIDVLDIIHENTDTSTTVSTKKRFDKTVVTL